MPPTSSVDKVHEAYGFAVGRGTIQRIYEGGKPMTRSLERLADHIKVPARVFFDDAGEAPAKSARTGTQPLALSLTVVLDQLDGLSPSRWTAVRAVLDQIVTRPDLRDEAESELLHMLTTRSDKQPGRG